MTIFFCFFLVLVWYFEWTGDKMCIFFLSGLGFRFSSLYAKKGIQVILRISQSDMNMSFYCTKYNVIKFILILHRKYIFQNILRKKSTRAELPLLLALLAFERAANFNCLLSFSDGMNQNVYANNVKHWLLPAKWWHTYSL